MDENGAWRMAPAYDLTFSNGPGGEQSTLVMGEGRKPGVSDLLKLAQSADLETAGARRIIEQTTTALQGWMNLAKNRGVLKANIKRIGDIVCKGKN